MAARAFADRHRYWLLILPALAAMLIFYVWPLIQIFAISFTEPTTGFGNYVELLSSRAIRTSFVITFRVAALTTVGCLLLGYVVAYAIYNTRARYVGLMLMLVLLPFWLSVLVRSFAWIVLLGRGGVVNDALIGLGLIDRPLALMHNEFGVLIAMVHVMLPYAVLPLMANMKGIDPSYVAAARGLGASELTAFRQVYLPQTLPGIFSAALLVFVISLGFYITPALLGGGRVLMISEYITYQIQEFLKWGLGTALSVALLVATAAVILAAARFVNLRKTLLERG
ncbi:putative spermidine/putrescine transport system permease protein [Tistlia consotensis]|uniref:Putative spermidine/putrescine transport system permease protein n=1 Tax=Tistlia consotensis USBA 355 TaxID=560819 RepID=A0A1Y6B9F1_9PROT|nr:ABC transporter permease [Tistlia consotensis]SME92631.1 putative spermidine/putrescine transport system permease protein [Tistlia consotensis USBA 355]SNR28134.1 putative spermidine/putrescine transport system permease protein [Tistlia consotensis]